MQTPSVNPARADACTEATQHPVALLLTALTAIVQETMAYSPVKPTGDDSHLPLELVDQAQRALARYGAQVVPYNEPPIENSVKGIAKAITITNEQATRAFEDWENDVRRDPNQFFTYEEIAQMEVCTVSEGRVICFFAYVRQVLTC